MREVPIMEYLTNTVASLGSRYFRKETCMAECTFCMRLKAQKEWDRKNQDPKHPTYYRAAMFRNEYDSWMGCYMPQKPVIRGELRYCPECGRKVNKD